MSSHEDNPASVEQINTALQQMSIETRITDLIDQGFEPDQVSSAFIFRAKIIQLLEHVEQIRDKEDEEFHPIISLIYITESLRAGTEPIENLTARYHTGREIERIEKLAAVVETLKTTPTDTAHLKFTAAETLALPFTFNERIFALITQTANEIPPALILDELDTVLQEVVEYIQGE